ncbi:MAG: DNA primase DnaG [Candidatus Bathyarchaeota archaeon]|nr:DNA primase DnaG [Candidatus Bathyarchaeota archaeon]
MAQGTRNHQMEAHQRDEFSDPGKAPEGDRRGRTAASVNQDNKDRVVNAMGDKDSYTGVKYTIHARFTIDGVVERHDVIGAIFGQTEGLFPKDFELRELQRVGKIGRIDIELKSANDQTTGTLTVPSSLDRPETAIIAAAMETVDRVGPCDAKISVESIKDVRVDKLKRIQERAKELMRDWHVKEHHDIEVMLEQVGQESKKIEPVHYGRERLTATPDISQRNDIILVEGRADVINLLRAGISGSIAVEGVKVPKTIRELSRKKEITAFLDGDRGGDLILRELMQVAKPKYVARAPRGSEVEELDPDQIKAALEAKVPVEEAFMALQNQVEAPPQEERVPEREQPLPPRPRPQRQRPPPVVVQPPSLAKEYIGLTGELKGTLEAVLIDKDNTQSERFPVAELVEKLKVSEEVKAVVFDGIVTGRLIDAAAAKGVKVVVGDRIAEGVRIPQGMEIKAFKDLF